MWSPPALGWSLFEFARNPYYLLVVTFVFPAYFAQSVVGDPVDGQTMVSLATAVAGVVCALTAPLLGAMMDRGGRRKPLIAVFLAAMGLAAATLWFALPKGQGGLGPYGVVVVLVAAYVAYTYSEVMHNGMLPLAGRREVLSHISGAGLGFGNGAGALCLAMWIGLVLTRDQLGVPPGFAIERFVGPAMMVWLAVFAVPFFLFMPDGAPPDGSWRRAAAMLFKGADGRMSAPDVARRFTAHIRGLFREHPDVMGYLVARIAYADALTTLLSLAGVYTAGVLGWDIAEVALYGIYGTAFAATGAFLGGVLDQKLGPRRSIMLELSVIVSGVVLSLSITQDSIGFGLIPAGHAVWASPVFSTLSDVVYLGLNGLISMAIGACLSSSRFMLVSIAPRHRVSEFFGLYMLSATVTVWMGPFLVGSITAATQDQRWGMSAVLILLVVGFGLFVWLRPKGKAQV